MHLFSRILAASALIAVGASELLANNGEIFPSQDAAKSAIDWKDGYFVINGKPTFLTSGEMHYARIPKELWKDRIWRSKMMGFNCMQMYVFWNATEVMEGQWTFEDNTDLDAWLTEVQKAGMYAVVRVGPYSCAEWEHGGFPAWLTAKPIMTIRDDNPLFLKYCDPHLAMVEKIVAKHQINHGGNVIMVQLENEHPKGWGTDSNDYLKHLYDEARKNGLEIPLFFSGLHHGGEPSGSAPYKPDASPWYSTEFWTGWIGKYGDMDPAMLQEKIAGTWKIISFGGAGYDYYMVHGGTNFGYSGDTYMTSYDYSAPIGETGQFHNFYYYAKRAATMARSFSDLLSGSHDDPALAKPDTDRVHLFTRTNPTEGSLVIINAFKGKDQSKQEEIPPSADAYTAGSADKNGAIATRITVNGEVLPHQGSLKVSVVDPQVLLLDLPFAGKAKFDSICASVLLRTTLGGTQYFVCYGAPGDTGEVNVSFDGASDKKSFNFTFPTDNSIKELAIDSKEGHKAIFLVENTDMTKRTWLADGKLYVGPSFIEETGGIEWPPEGGKGVVYSDAGKSEISSAGTTLATLPALDKWSWRDGAPERAANFDVSSWMKSDGPVPMARLDGYANRYAWYRTDIKSDSDQTMNLKTAGSAGQTDIWLNGEPQDDLSKLPLKKGDNQLAIMFKTGARNKWFSKIGYTLSGGYNGLWGGCNTDETPVDVPLQGWVKWSGTGAADAAESISTAAYTPNGDWKPVDKLVESAGANTYRCSFAVDAANMDSYLTLNGAGHLNLFLNGRPYNAGDPDCKLVAGQNYVCLQGDEKADKTKPLPTLTPKLHLWHNSPIAHQTWYLHSGLDGLEETAVIGRVTNWPDFMAKPWNDGKPSTQDSPTFWKTTFTYHPTAEVHETIGLDKTMDVLTSKKWLHSGHLWLNGHNLGEVPQAQPLYMPECWLKDGANDLVIFDMNGNSPEGVQLTRIEGFAVGH